MDHFKKIFTQSLWQVLGKGITSISTFIILGLIARNYGEHGTGVFTLALTYLGIFYLFSDFGFNAHVLKIIQSLEFNVQKDYFRKLLGTRLVWSGFLVVLAIGLLFFWPFTSSDFALSVIFGSLAIIGSGIFITCNLIFQSRLRYDLSVLATSIGTVLSLAVYIFFISQRSEISLLLIAHLLSWIIIATCSLYLVRNYFKNILPIFNFNYAAKLVKESWPIAATLSLNVLYFRSDAFLIAYFKNISDVGIYNVAYSVFQTALVVPTFIMNSYYPMMLKTLGGLRSVGLVLIGLSVAGTISTIVLAPLIISILTGSGFSGSVESLQILSLGFPAFFISALFMWLLVTKNMYKKMFLLYTSGFFLNLILNFIFIPQHSFIAASWTTVISEYAILLMQIFILRGILLR